MQNKTCAGLSIVEALVTMVILMIVMGGVYQIFESNSLTYRMQQGMSRVQENGRFAIELLLNDIRMAGYLGCVSKNTVTNKLPVTNGIYNYSLPLEELDANELTIRRALDKRADFIGISQTNSTTTLEMSTNGTIFNDGEYIVLNNCDAILIAKVSGTDSSNNTVSIDVVDIPSSFMEHKKGEILNVGAITYYVDEGASKIPALFRKVQNQSNSTQEVVEGVDAIRFIYRIDGSNDLVNAGDVTDWNRVRGVQIALLAASPDIIPNMEPDMTSFKFFEGTVNEVEIDDMNIEKRKRLLRIFGTTVGLRNRLP